MTDELLTVSGLMTNPPGSRSRAVTSRYIFLSYLWKVYIDAMKDINLRKRFSINVISTEKDVYRVFGKVPSQKYLVDYDVVLDIDMKDQTNAKDAPIKVFTNTPSWVFTYGYVFNKLKIIPKDLVWAIGKEAKNEKPKVTNPEESLGFDKVVHQFLLFMVNHAKLWKKEDFERLIKSSKEKTFNSKNDTLSFEYKLSEYNKKKELFKEKERKEKQKERTKNQVLKKKVKDLEKKKQEKRKNKK